MSKFLRRRDAFFAFCAMTIGLGAISCVVTACDRSADDGPSSVVGTPPSAPSGATADGALSEAELGERYEAWRARFEAEPGLANSDAFGEVEADLRRISNEASQPAMRANAALMLGALYEARSQVDKAIDFYRHADKLVPDDAGPKMALALALASVEKFEEAAKVQAEATKLDPDNLENWLALAEMQLKGGDAEGAKQTYVDYERRRKGLIDGLTLKTGDAYRTSPQERAGCARALASSSDQGTGIALIYALKSDPQPVVRVTVAEVMGIQRLAMYRPVLQAVLEKETDAKTKEAATWALAEIERDPVEAAAGGGAPPPTASGGGERPADVAAPPQDSKQALSKTP